MTIELPINVLRDFLPDGKHAAVCFSIDDVHPGTSRDTYEAGGDLGNGALGHVEFLLERHPQLWATLFVTADWREILPLPSRDVARRIRGVRDRVYLTPILPKGTMRLDRHGKFCKYLSSLERVEVALHGLHHVHKGEKVMVEFQNQGLDQSRNMLIEALEIFEQAQLKTPSGMCPPGWNLPSNLAEAMVQVGLEYAASARDIFTPISACSVNSMSGLQGVSILYPELIQDGHLIHIPTNFQATSSVDRAWQILDCGGLLSIKAHIIKNGAGHIALDGMDSLYRNYLDALFTMIQNRYGDAIWWTSMQEIATSARRSTVDAKW